MIQEEKQLGHNPTPEVVVMALRSDSGRSSTASYKSNPKPVCTHCGKTGHTMEKCYRLHGFPPGFKFTKNRNASAHVASTDQEDQSTPVLSILQEQCQNLISSLQSQNFMSNPVLINQVSASQPNSLLISNFSGKIIADLPHLSSLHIPYVQHTSCHSTTCSSFSNSWILNTGATDHMVSSISLLTTITSCVHIKIHLPNGEHVIATHIGTVTLTAGFILTKPPSNRLKRKKKLIS